MRFLVFYFILFYFILQCVRLGCKCTRVQESREGEHGLLLASLRRGQPFQPNVHTHAFAVREGRIARSLAAAVLRSVGGHNAPSKEAAPSAGPPGGGGGGGGPGGAGGPEGGSGGAAAASAPDADAARDTAATLRDAARRAEKQAAAVNAALVAAGGPTAALLPAAPGAESQLLTQGSGGGLSRTSGGPRRWNRLLDSIRRVAGNPPSPHAGAAAHQPHFYPFVQAAAFSPARAGTNFPDGGAGAGAGGGAGTSPGGGWPQLPPFLGASPARRERMSPEPGAGAGTGAGAGASPPGGRPQLPPFPSPGGAPRRSEGGAAPWQPLPGGPPPPAGRLSSPGAAAYAAEGQVGGGVPLPPGLEQSLGGLNATMRGAARLAPMQEWAATSAEVAGALGAGRTSAGRRSGGGSGGGRMDVPFSGGLPDSSGAGAFWDGRAGGGPAPAAAPNIHGPSPRGSLAGTPPRTQAWSPGAALPPFPTHAGGGGGGAGGSRGPSGDGRGVHLGGVQMTGAAVAGWGGGAAGAAAPPAGNPRYPDVLPARNYAVQQSPPPS
jgi:hypothetical protein